MFDHRDGRSQRKAARQLGISQSHLNTILNTKTDVRYYEKTTVPHRTPIQVANAKTRCRWIYDNYRNFDFVIDDESYFTLSHSTLAGNTGFYSSDKKSTPRTAATKTKQKYENKLLVWIAISPKGMTHARISPSGQAIKGPTYLNKCLKRHLLPFIREMYPDNNYIFWPDLASAHYSKIVLAWCKTENIPIVPRGNNPANCPEQRAIEDFWAYLKRLVYDNNWVAKDLNQLRTRIKRCLTQVDKNLVRSLAEITNKRLRQVFLKNIE